MRIAKAKATSFEIRPKGPHIKETKRVHKLLGTYLDMTTLTPNPNKCTHNLRAISTNIEIFSTTPPLVKIEN